MNSDHKLMGFVQPDHFLGLASICLRDVWMAAQPMPTPTTTAPTAGRGHPISFPITDPTQPSRPRVGELQAELWATCEPLCDGESLVRELGSAEIILSKPSSHTQKPGLLSHLTSKKLQLNM